MVCGTENEITYAVRKLGGWLMHKSVRVGTKYVAQGKGNQIEFGGVSLNDRLNKLESKVGVGAANIPVEVDFHYFASLDRCSGWIVILLLEQYRSCSTISNESKKSQN